MDEVSISEREGGLHRGLTRTQIVMIGLGGAIGTGLFMGSGIAIGYAGPAVIGSHAIAGFAAVVMVFSLSEMACVAERLKQHFGDTEHVAHLSGAAFAVLIQQGVAPGLAAHEQIFRLFDQPLMVRGRDIPVPLRCGLARFPTHGTDAETLESLLRADCLAPSPPEGGF